MGCKVEHGLGTLSNSVLENSDRSVGVQFESFIVKNDAPAEVEQRFSKTSPFSSSTAYSKKIYKK